MLLPSPSPADSRGFNLSASSCLPRIPPVLSVSLCDVSLSLSLSARMSALPLHFAYTKTALELQVCAARRPRREKASIILIDCQLWNVCLETLPPVVLFLSQVAGISLRYSYTANRPRFSFCRTQGLERLRPVFVWDDVALNLPRVRIMSAAVLAVASDTTKPIWRENRYLDL